MHQIHAARQLERRGLDAPWPDPYPVPPQPRAPFGGPCFAVMARKHSCAPVTQSQLFIRQHIVVQRFCYIQSQGKDGKTVQHLPAPSVEPFQRLAGHGNDRRAGTQACDFGVGPMCDNIQVIKAHQAPVMQIPLGQRPVVFVNHCDRADIHASFVRPSPKSTQEV